MVDVGVDAVYRQMSSSKVTRRRRRSVAGCLCRTCKDNQHNVAPVFAAEDRASRKRDNSNPKMDVSDSVACGCLF